MSFTSYTQDFDSEHEQHVYVTDNSDYATGVVGRIRLLSLIDFVADSGGGTESALGMLAPKYLDLQTGKITTEPTPESIFIGIGGASGCVVVGDVELCYKKLDDVLDWETLQNLLTAFKLIEDRVKTWSDIIKTILFE